ncbi:LLM class flavin-dependent oxidoreductase [Paraburkholderia bannensis]|uniref:LLM class flavin-dependent oxidoreductase n=1 Tax=Paraburkholderia bannensis TaxID=765414 RepID=UPI002AB7ABB6|nr:LLM class flavin-dependent oxidoreductase [Paraburkholderia bannensis]
MKREMHLGAFLMETGHHLAAWRLADAQADAGLDIRAWIRLAQLAESACFDALFVADSVAANTGPGADRVARADRLDPLTLLPALAVATQRIGLIGTATTSYNEPYHVARKFASLDHISDGRAGWNLVTTDNAAEAGNFGRAEHYSHVDRYARAEEFHRVVTALWDSWDEASFVRDKRSGRYYDAATLRVPLHRGEHFSVDGPLNVARTPQGWPVIVQAGSSERGRELAARTAEVVFTAQRDFDTAQVFYRDLKQRVVAAGRASDALKIMPGLSVIVAPTLEEAREREAELQALVHPEAGLALLGRMIGNFDLGGVDLDAPLPELPLTDSGQRSRQQLLTSIAGSERLTVRQLYLRIAGGRGHFSLVGTPQSVADAMQHWFESGAADGFNIMAADLPGGLERFCALVVPELQRRGLFRTTYQGRTLRDHLGLQRPTRER